MEIELPELFCVKYEEVFYKIIFKIFIYLNIYFLSHLGGEKFKHCL